MLQLHQKRPATEITGLYFHGPAALTRYIKTGGLATPPFSGICRFGTGMWGA